MHTSNLKSVVFLVSIHYLRREEHKRAVLILMEERRENKRREEGLERMEVGLIDRLST